MSGSIASICPLTRASSTAARTHCLRSPLAELLDAVGPSRQFCLIRAAVHANAPLWLRYPRRWHADHRQLDDGLTGPLIERRWLPVDIDELPLAEGLAYSDPDRIVAWAVDEILPAPFGGTSCVWQLSGSAGLRTSAGPDEALAVPMTTDERRYQPFHISAHRVGDKAWFDAILAEMRGGGYEAMMHDLMHRKYDDGRIWFPLEDSVDLDAMRAVVLSRRSGSRWPGSRTDGWS